MNTETIQTDEPAVKRADALEVGDYVIEEPEYGRPIRPVRVALAHPFTNGDGRPFVSLVLDCLDGGEVMYLRVHAEKRYEIADEQDLAAMQGGARRHALAQALRHLADDVVNNRLPIPRYRLHITGCVDSRAELERWARHLGVEVRMGGTEANIPVANKEIDVADGLMLDVQFQSDPEPKRPAELTDDEIADEIDAAFAEPEQEWLFTFGSGQQYDGRFVRIRGTYDTARARMLAVFGNRWCAQYDWRRFDEEGLPARVTELPRSEWPPHIETAEGIRTDAWGFPLDPQAGE